MSHPNKRRRRNKNNRNHEWSKPTKPWKINNNNNSGCCQDWNYNKKQVKAKIYKCPYKEQYFDTHCHLDWILYKSGYGLRDLPTFTNINFSGNFGGAVTVSCASDMIRPVSELINSTNIAYKNIYAAFGLHPHNAKEWNDTVKQHIVFALKTGKWNINQNNIQKQTNINGWLCLCGHKNIKDHIFCSECAWEPNQEYLQNQDILNIVKDITTNEKKECKEDTKPNKVVAVGECGLDFHYNRSPQHIQKKVFIEQIEISKQLNLPIVIHARKAERDTIEIMKKYCPKQKRIHLHCFTDSLEYGKVMLDSFPNLMIGFTGAITFKNANNNRNTVRNIPLNRILLETDGPYMAPYPYRGQVSHPGFIPIIAEQIAQLHGIKDVNNVLRQCRLNANKVYGV